MYQGTLSRASLTVINVGETRALRKCEKISKGGPDGCGEHGRRGLLFRDNKDGEGMVKEKRSHQLAK